MSTQKPILKSSPKTALSATSKKVSFNRMVTVRLAVHFADLNEATKLKCWYSRQEAMSIHRANQATVRGVMACSMVEGSDSEVLNTTFSLSSNCHCARGLESFLPQVLKIRQRRRREAQAVVFGVQNHLNRDEVACSSVIAEAYARATCDSKIRATEFGRLDEMEAKKIFHESSCLKKVASHVSSLDKVALLPVRCSNFALQREPSLRRFRISNRPRMIAND